MIIKRHSVNNVLKKNYYILFCRINFVYCKKMIKNILQECFCINFSNIIKLVIVVFITWEYFYYCINFRRKKSIIIFYSAKLTLFIVKEWFIYYSIP